MVEGTSYGSPHAMAIASHFGDRVSAMHLVVPYINYELREELGNMNLQSGDEIFTCDSKTWPRSMFNCSPCTFCCCSCMMQCIACCPGCFADKGTKQLQEHVPGAVEAVNADIRRSWIQGVYGLIHNSFVDVISKNWGFDVRKIPTKKVIVSYAIDDKNSPTEQGKWLAEELFVGKDGMAQCKVNVGEGFQHSSHSVRLFNGEFVRELYEFSTTQ